MKNWKQKIFVGSSSEAHEIDRDVREILEDLGAEPISWRSIFKPGDFGIESILRVSEQVNGAILIATPDDKTWYRCQEMHEPRDNIIFELGVLVSSLGRYRVALLESQQPSLPTDLAGLTTIRFHADKKAANERLIKNWLTELESRTPTDGEIESIVRLLRRGLSRVDSAWRPDIEEFVIRGFRRTLLLALRGEIPLTPGQYYSCIYKEIVRSSKGMEILAVSTLSSLIWSEDRDQQRYFSKNLDAVKRGVRVKRLFLLPEKHDLKLDSIIRRQKAAGIKVRIAGPAISAELRMLEDIVLFRESPSRFRGFISFPAFDNPRRIRGGKILLDPEVCEHQRQIFEAAWAISREYASTSLQDIPKIRTRPAPGEGMDARWLTQPVVTCEEAAAARCVPLMNELKTLILETSYGLVAAHLPGANTLSLRLVKDLLEAEEARLASRKILKDLGLAAGTVCAILNPVWSLPHLVCSEVVLLDFVTTNNGSLTGYFSFDPRILMQAESVQLAKLSKA